MADKIEIKALIRPDLDTGGVVKKVSTIQSLLKKIDLPPTLQKEFNGLFNDFNDNIDKINNAFSKGFETKGSVKSLNSLTSHMEKITDKIIAKWNQASSNEGFAKQFSPEIASQIDNIDKEIKDLRVSITKLNAKPLGDIKQMVEELKGQGAKKTGNQVASLLDQGDLKQAIGLLTLTIEKRKSLNETMFKGAAKTTLENDNKALEKMLNALVEIDEKSDALRKIEDLKTERISKMADLMASVEKACQEAGVDVATLGEYINKTGSNIDDAAASTQQFTSEVDEIKDRIKYFFSLNNAIQLVRQALRQTFEAAKELDAAMTETAVVTDFSVGDMWDMLPKYTKTAQKLGATTKGVYETLTLFYQQGLDTNEAMALGVETLEMARIAGMDYEEATSKMTAALRGFNMELNELSAQRVNDVYSELAAITAADTDQIATAMTKTASIANSANMEFETTAAFLSQIIETTQESAETAGTAMKTVIARFTELKKDPSLIGEVDGEVIDANKIETALNSIGVALRDNLTGQFRDLDDVFLDIAQKWEGLDTNTQRYIATIAAGSRQQSRFIAMMSDYERTMELVNAANNSAGSSQAQFDKTLESMEAKLNQLKNTWQEFTLGLMDQGVLKGLIEVLNGILTAINKITNLPGVLGGASKALLGFFTLFTGKKLFSAISKSIIPNLVGTFTGAGVKSGMSFGSALVDEFSNVKKVINKFFGKEIIDPRTAEGFKQIFKIDYADDSFQKLTASLKDYTEAQITLNKVESMRSRLSETETITEERKVILSQTTTKAVLQEAAAENSLAKATGLTNIQARQALQIASAGVPIDHAAIAAKYGITSATIAQKLGVENLTDAKEEDINATIIQMVAEKTSTLGRAKTIATLLFSTKAQKREAAAKLLNATATGTATKAQIVFNAVLQALPIGWVVAGIVAIGAAIAGLIVIIKHFSLDAQMERAAEGAQRSAEAFESAKQAYDDLMNTIEEHKNAVDSIDNLTKGTIEFTNAIYEANLKMLELMDTYSKLRESGMTETDENGLIVLTTEGEQYLKNSANQKKLNTQQIQTVSNIEANNIQAKVQGEAFAEALEKKKALGQATGGVLGGATGAAAGALGGAALGVKAGATIGTFIAPAMGTLVGAAIGGLVGGIGGALVTGISGAIGGSELGDELAGKKTKEKFDTALSDDRFNTSKELNTLFAEQMMGPGNKRTYTQDFTDLANAAGLTTDELYDLKDSVIDYKISQEEATEKNREQVEELLRSRASSGLASSNLINKLPEIFSAGNEDLLNFTEEQINDEEENLDSKKEKEQKAEEWASKGLIDEIDLTGLSEEAMAKKLYSAVTGIAEKDITLGTQDIEIELAKFSLSVNKGNELSKEMNAFYEQFAGMPKQYLELGEVLIESGKYTLEDIKTWYTEDGKITAEFQRLLDSVDKGSLLKSQLEKQKQKNESLAKTTEEIFSAFAEGKALEDIDTSVLTALNLELSNLSGVYDKNVTAAEEWASVANQGVAAQMSYLINLKVQQEKDYLEKVQQARAYRAELEATIGKLRETGQTSIDFDINGDGIKEVGVSLQELEQYLQNTDWTIEIEAETNFDSGQDFVQNIIDDFSGLGSIFETLSGKMKYTVEEAQKLAKVFPTILENATITGEGLIILDEAARASAIQTQKDILKGSEENSQGIIDIKIAQLDTEIEAKESEIKAVEEILATENENYARAALAKILMEGSVTAKKAEEGSEQLENSAEVEEGRVANNEAGLTAQLTNEVSNEKIKEKLWRDEQRFHKDNEVDTLEKLDLANEDHLREFMRILGAKALSVLETGNYEVDIAEETATLTNLATSKSLDEDINMLGQKGGVIAQFLNKTRTAVQDFLKREVDIRIQSHNTEEAIKEKLAQKNGKNYFDPSTTQDPYELTGIVVGDLLNDFEDDFSSFADSFFKGGTADYSIYKNDDGGLDLGKDTGLDISEYLSEADFKAEIDEEKLKKEVEVDYDENGNIDYLETFRNYYQSESTNLQNLYKERQDLVNGKTLIEAAAKNALSQLDNIGKDSDKGGSGSSDKDDKWEYKRDYDENIKSQINAADKKLSKLEAEFEGLLNDENATLEDMIAKKLEMAAVDEEKIKLIEQQIELDRAEIEKLNKQHPEWADLVYVDENGAFQVDKDKVNAQGFNKEQGEEFEKWVQEQTAAHENLLSSSLDMVTTINEAAERLKIITNEFDQIYNNELKIEGLQRKRSKLETEYNELLEKNNNNVQGLVDNLSEQYDSLKEEQKLLEQNHNLSQLQLDSFLGSSKNQAFQDYYNYDKETNSFEINVEAMEKLAAFDEELYNVVSDFLETAMGYWEDNIEWEEKLLDNTEAIAKKQKEAEESFDNLQIRLYDEIINYMEQEIEAVEELYSSINDSNERILDSINESLAQQRQDRQNAETESEINDMRNRLAYLQMDTSGANQNEILNLQKQIREKEQDYTDTLIDQKIDELQKQNDFAAEQRERQIQLLQQEHEEAQLNGSYLKSAKEALDSLLVNNGDLNKAFYGTIGNGDENSPLKKIFPNGESVGKIISDNLLADTGKMPTQSQTDENTLTIGDQVAKALVRIQELRSTPNADISRTVLRVASGLDKVSDLDYYIYDLDKDGKVTEEDARLWLKGAVGLASVPKYATGGLADFTGPAWLDGTKSRPELVLNQKDTQNFLQLKDILASFMSNNGSLQNSAENRGDNYYEIHLNVEKITSDYDVEQLANKVKSIIAEDANSRGVNSIYRRR